MRKLSILTFITLDNVMQSPSSPDEDSSGGFKYGGWARNCWDDVMEQVVTEAMSEPYDLLLGRTTYELFTNNFTKLDSDNDDPVANKLNNAIKYVVTSREDSLNWKNSKRITGDIVTAISKLKSQDGPLLQVHGSWQLIQTLLANGLIDEFRLWIFPVIIGSGKRLFNQDFNLTELNLIKTQASPSGSVMQIYKKK